MAVRGLGRFRSEELGGSLEFSAHGKIHEGCQALLVPSQAMEAGHPPPRFYEPSFPPRTCGSTGTRCRVGLTWTWAARLRKRWRSQISSFGLGLRRRCLTKTSPRTVSGISQSFIVFNGIQALRVFGLRPSAHRPSPAFRQGKFGSRSLL